MKTVNRGLLLLLINATLYALASLGFVRSGFNTSLLATWFGLLGSIIALTKLITEPKFYFFLHRRDRNLYFCFLNGFIFGGASFGLHFWSLRFILPSDSILVNAFFSLFSSVVVEIIKEKKRPTVLSIISVLAGVIGTGLICNPQARLLICLRNVMMMSNVMIMKLG